MIVVDQGEQVGATDSVSLISVNKQITPCPAKHRQGYLTHTKRPAICRFVLLAFFDMSPLAYNWSGFTQNKFCAFFLIYVLSWARSNEISAVCTVCKRRHLSKGRGGFFFNQSRIEVWFLLVSCPTR